MEFKIMFRPIWYQEGIIKFPCFTSKNIYFLLFRWYMNDDCLRNTEFETDPYEEFNYLDLHNLREPYCVDELSQFNTIIVNV
jgi:hypothetical protein